MTKTPKKNVIAAFAIALSLSLGCDDDSGGSSGAGGAGAEGGAGGQAQACTPDECGPAPGAPNELCPDGENYSGFGSCARAEDGSCGYPRIECPDADGGTGGAGGEGGMGNGELTSQAVCQKIASLAETVGCAVVPVEDCLADPEGPQALGACVLQFHALIDCMAANREDCVCRDGDNGLDCGASIDVSRACVEEAEALVMCIEANYGD
ncbi:MAG: hypothetical protein ACON3Z_05580 [Bradymonadia bacterium]